MSSEISGITQNHVAKGAYFDADVSLFHLVLKVGEQLQLESVSDSLGSEKDSVVEVLSISVVSLSTMEEAGHVFSVNLDNLFRRQDLLSKRRNLFSVVFLVDHVETSNKLH